MNTIWKPAERLTAWKPNVQPELYHHGVKGMKWGKHLFGKENTVQSNGGGGGVSNEELELFEKLKEQYGEGKAREMLRDMMQKAKEALNIPEKVGYNAYKSYEKEKAESDAAWKYYSDNYDARDHSDEANRARQKYKKEDYEAKTAREKYEKTPMHRLGQRVKRGKDALNIPERSGYNAYKRYKKEKAESDAAWKHYSDNYNAKDHSDEAIRARQKHKKEEYEARVAREKYEGTPMHKASQYAKRGKDYLSRLMAKRRK